MAKDPAFLFYTQDFLTGTMFMTDDEVGKYIRLLCAQHQQGGLINKAAFNMIVKDHDLLRQKFIETEDGFFNARLMEEMEKRERKCSNLSANAKQRWEKEKQKHSKCNANAYANVMQPENENENVNENINISNININKGKFKKPTLEEVALYCLERKNKIDPQTFIDHYTSNGWRVGKNPMSDWKAAVRTWEKNNFEGSNKNGTGKRSYQQNTGRELPPDIAESVDATTREWLEKKRLAAANQDGKNTR